MYVSMRITPRKTTNLHIDAHSDIGQLINANDHLQVIDLCEILLSLSCYFSSKCQGGATGAL